MVSLFDKAVPVLADEDKNGGSAIQAEYLSPTTWVIRHVFLEYLSHGTDVPLYVTSVLGVMPSCALSRLKARSFRR